jgi:hypothetical protein
VAKSVTVNLNAFYNSRRTDASPWEDRTAEAVPLLPRGRQHFWGIPFRAGAGDPSAPGLVVAGARGATGAITIPLKGTATHLVFAHFCDSRARTTVAGQTKDYPNPVVTAPGEHLANYVLVYADGSEHSTAIRRRFEINQVQTRMQSGFLNRPHQGLTPLPFRGPYPADMWGRYQTGASVGPAGRPSSPREDTRARIRPAPSWSIYALPNPHPRKRLTGLRIEPTGAAAVAIGAITRFTGNAHPLRHERLETLRVDLPRGAERAAVAEGASIDLGVIARRYTIQGFDPDEWLKAPVKGRGEAPDAPKTSLALDIAGSVDATLTVAGRELSVGDLYSPRHSVRSEDGRVAARVLTPQRTWVHGRIVDASTGKPTAARIHFRSEDGRYFPPYGHRHEVNDNWFEDYGADVKLGDTQYAYVDGAFQGELPVGEVYVEAAKGFEYEPLRARLQIKPGQRELEIRLERAVDLSKQGWIRADTHVHFISPETARLEGQAEGLNVINLLAAQWGDLFTNVGDITGRLSGSSTDDMLVWVGTENRNHFLGHISLQGTQGQPVFPMSTSGPSEGYFGDTTMRAMSEWADECRSKGGLVVVPHFPYPHSEIIAEIVRGRVDGVEFWDFWTPTMDTFSFHELYRLLNCGYRVAVVGGTDKMSAAMPVGNVRTYAHTDGEVSFDAWVRAVRAGRTYTTSGPLVRFAVEGRHPGAELKLPSRGGTVHVEAEAVSLTGPVNKLEVVYNGRVVAQAASRAGSATLKLSQEVKVPGSGWLAARCVSQHKAWSVWPQHIAAHTSAVYVKAGRDEVFDNPTAEYLVTVMKGGLAWLDTLATRDTPERHAAIRHVFEDAIAQVQAKQRAHGR